MALNLSREETIANHRKMWNWIADETLKRKKKVYKIDYFEEHDISSIPDHLCYCCDYINSSRNGKCSRCPFVWNHNMPCYFSSSEFAMWEKETSYSRETNYQEAAKLARQIANLPERRVYK